MVCWSLYVLFIGATGVVSNAEAFNYMDMVYMFSFIR